MNNLMEIELDLLEKLKKICEKHHIRFYASDGTLLGAVRHKGFIPWDDDIDIALLWPDYKKLMEVAPLECEYPYFFQSIYTEEECMPSACRLRRSDTTGFTRWEQKNVGPEYNKGIFIDIIPLFNVPDSIGDKQKQKEQVTSIWEAIHGYDAIKQRSRGGMVNPQWETYIPSLIRNCGTTDIDKIDIVSLKEGYYDACAMFSQRTKEIGMTSVKCFYPNWMWETEWFDDYVLLPFEDTSIPCPICYEKVLEKEYGDWRTPVQNGSIHELVAVSISIPWKEYDSHILV